MVTQRVKSTSSCMLQLVTQDKTKKTEKLLYKIDSQHSRSFHSKQVVYRTSQNLNWALFIRAVHMKMQPKIAQGTEKAVGKHQTAPQKHWQQASEQKLRDSWTLRAKCWLEKGLELWSDTSDLLLSHSYSVQGKQTLNTLYQQIQLHQRNTFITSTIFLPCRNNPQKSKLNLTTWFWSFLFSQDKSNSSLCSILTYCTTI